MGAPAWDVLLSTFPRNRPGNKADAQAEKAWRDATVDSTVGDLGKVDSSMDDADRLKDIRGEGAARPIGTTLELPSDGPAGEVLRVHNAFYDALGRGDEAAMAGVWSPAGRAKGDSVGDTNAIDRFVSRGAVLDNWGTVLRPDRRPEGLKLSDVDVTVERDQATVTVLETVANGGDSARHAELREGGRRMGSQEPLHHPVRQGYRREDRAEMRREGVRGGAVQGCRVPKLTIERTSLHR